MCLACHCWYRLWSLTCYMLPCYLAWIWCMVVFAVCRLGNGTRLCSCNSLAVEFFCRVYSGPCLKMYMYILQQTAIRNLNAILTTTHVIISLCVHVGLPTHGGTGIYSRAKQSMANAMYQDQPAVLCWLQRSHCQFVQKLARVHGLFKNTWDVVSGISGSRHGTQPAYQLHAWTSSACTRCWEILSTYLITHYQH